VRKFSKNTSTKIFFKRIQAEIGPSVKVFKECKHKYSFQNNTSRNRSFWECVQRIQAQR